MHDSADKDPVGFLGIEHKMSLKPKAAIAGSEVVHGLSDLREVGEQAEGALQPRKISFGLVGAELRGAVFVYFDEFGFRPCRERKLIHGCARRGDGVQP